MRPIEIRVDHAYTHALRCVEYRVPKDDRLEQSAFVLAIALRYALTGAAATHHLLKSMEDSEAETIAVASRAWPKLVLEHVRSQVRPGLPMPRREIDCTEVSRLAEAALYDYLALYHKHCSASICLEESSRSFQHKHVSAITKGWPWFRHRRAKELFRQSAAESTRFASLFYERRMADLDEVPEIALLGE